MMLPISLIICKGTLSSRSVLLIYVSNPLDIIFLTASLEGTTAIPCATTPLTTRTAEITCPTATCSVEEPILGTGIGLELSPSQADVAIEALFAISLTLTCVMVLLVFLQLCRSRRSTKESNSVDSFAMANEAAITKHIEARQDTFTSL